MEDELKPCPFCDGEAKIFTFGLERYRTIGCSKCGVQLPVYETIEQAIKAWNNRPNPWHIGTPTEEGWYQIAIRFCNRIEYDSRKCIRTIDNDGNECMRFDGCNPVLAWQKINPYKESTNDRT